MHLLFIYTDHSTMREVLSMSSPKLCISHAVESQHIDFLSNSITLQFSQCVIFSSSVTLVVSLNLICLTGRLFLSVRIPLSSRHTLSFLSQLQRSWESAHELVIPKVMLRPNNSSEWSHVISTSLCLS